MSASSGGAPRSRAPRSGGAGAARAGVAGIPRGKGHLSRVELAILAALAAAPLVSIAIRVLALPGVMGPGLGGLRAIAVALNQALSLGGIPTDQRDHVLYLLLLPTCALVVAIARLTFGIRVLGFRSILISVGFHQSGVLPSLILIAVGVAAIVMVRPWLRRIRLPYYARISVILCVVAMTMVGALLAGPWLRSDVVWGMAYFPVIVLGMLAEGIAHTLDRDNVVAATWRAITTILLAFVIAMICWIPALRDLMLQFPELVLTQIVAIVLVSEYLDLGLLQDWDQKVARALLPGRRPGSGPIPVAVVRNRVAPDAGDAAEARSPVALRSVRKIASALESGGHPVRVFEGDATLVRELRRFFPRTAPDGGQSGIVLNLAHGPGGEAGATQVPAVLELAGVPYAGPSPAGHAIASDRLALLLHLRAAGIPTAEFRAMSRTRRPAGGLRYPVVVRPRHDAEVPPLVARDPRRLRAAVRAIERRHRQEVVVEERAPGRRVCVALLGNDTVECLPLVELDSKRRLKICPARLEEPLAERVREIARASFRASACRDYARVDVRVTDAGEIRVVGVGTLGILAAGGSFALAGIEAGGTFSALVCRIVEIARQRHLARDAERSAGEAPRRREPLRALAPGASVPAAVGLTSAAGRD